MQRNDSHYFVITLLILGSVYLFISGLIMDTQGLHRFAWHSQVGYAWIALALAHLSLSWGRVKAYLTHRFRPHHFGPAHSDHPAHKASHSGHAAAVNPPRRGILVAAIALISGWLLGRLSPASPPPEAADSAADWGLFYHRWSKTTLTNALQPLLNWGTQPTRYKTYPQVQQIDLPDPVGGQGLSLEQAIATRRSQREYQNRSLPLVTLSQLLHLAQGITRPDAELRAVSQKVVS
jgi:hypothetical protein